MTSNKPKKKSFNYTPTHATPPLPAIAESWALDTLYYTDEHDDRIESDLKAAESAYKKFAKRWRGQAFTTDTTLLLAALRDSEAITGNPRFSKPGRYFWLRTCLNTNDTVAEKQLSLISRRLRKASDETLFFSLELGRLPKSAQKTLLAHPDLAHFRYYLERLFISAAHHLSEPEEKIINLKSRQAYGRWVDMTEKIISQRHITWKGKRLALPTAIEQLSTATFTDKPRLWAIILTELEQIGEVAEHEFNAIITDVRTEDELRGYKKPYSATAQSYQDSEKSLETLVNTISTEGFALSHEFYRLKAAFHGVPTLAYSQRNESAGAGVSISFTDAVTICRDVFYGVNERYGTLFDTMLARGQIDVWPKSGKTGGAFMSATTGQPIQVMLNHVTDFKSLETLAHEMGHAIHADRSATQTPFYDNHSIITAETASTLFENLVFDAVFTQASADEQLVLMHDRINRDISTIQRQIAFFNAEKDIHDTIHREGGMSNSELAACMERHLRSYLGPAVTVTATDGYSYVYVSHLRYGFYVYSYAYGLLMSTIMAARFKADPTYRTTIDTFLTAGESADVATIFKRIGINTTKPDTFSQALQPLRDDIATFKALLKKQSLAK